jgi:aryl-alcohol dehydrogenase-like predicted oxidoreductase
LQFAAANDRIHSTLVGTSQAVQIAENARWIDEPIDEALLAEIQDILEPIRNLTWPSGRPENAEPMS